MSIEQKPYEAEYRACVEACAWMVNDKTLHMEQGKRYTVEGIAALRAQRDELRADLLGAEEENAVLRAEVFRLEDEAVNARILHEAELGRLVAAGANFYRERGITLLEAKWLDPRCHKGCQSLVLEATKRPTDFDDRAVSDATAKVRAVKLPRRSNHDKRDRYQIHGLPAAVTIEAVGFGDGWNNDGAKETADILTKAAPPA